MPPQLQGSLFFDQQALGAAKVEGIQLDAHFGAGDFSGTLHARFEETSGSNAPDSSVALSIMKLAEWGQVTSNPLMCAE